MFLAPVALAAAVASVGRGVALPRARAVRAFALAMASRRWGCGCLADPRAKPSKSAHAVRWASGSSSRKGPGAFPVCWNRAPVWAMFESFLYLAPYFFTPGLVALALVGALRGGWPSQRGWAVLAGWAWFVACIVVSQAFFQSFLSRYLLPITPLVAVAGGLGIDVALRRFPRFGTAVVALSLAWGLAFGLCSIVLQRQAFGDLAQAGRALADLDPAGAPIFSNETYKAEAGMGAIKLEWWSGRSDIRPFDELPTKGRPGSLIVLSSAYGGPEGYMAASRRW